MLTRALSLLAVALLWLLHFLPFPLLAALGRGLGALLYLLARQRRKVVEINLDLCFPEISATTETTAGPRTTETTAGCTVDRKNLAKTHFSLLGRSLIERSIFWWSSPERIQRIVKVSGEERITTALSAGRPVILLAPHFLGLDAGGIAITMRFDIVSIYSEQTNPIFNRVLLKGRSRFGNQLLLSPDHPRPVRRRLTHDPSAALYIDGKLVAAAEEERFVRDKHAKNRMPYESAAH
jgi:Kdo2-lipid IVA lauroyltransferase/acyltransferase